MFEVQEQVAVRGEMGRRIDITMKNNLLVLDADRDFLQPFQAKSQTSGYIGLGKLIDAAVRFAAYSRDEKVVKKAFSLSEGAFSEVMKLNDSTYTFIKVEEKKKASTRPFEEVRGKIESKLRRSMEEELHAKVLQELRDAADIEIVMTEQDFIFEPPETIPPEVEEGTETSTTSGSFPSTL